MDNFLIIDLGTNTVIFSVIRQNNSELIITHEKSITTRIGENISNQNGISKSALDRNVKTISEEIQKIQKKAQIKSIFAMTTEAVRCATNGDSCVKILNSKCGVKFNTISGLDEARFTADALYGFSKDKGLCAICDIGGGSTEVIITNNGKTKNSESFPIGVVRLEEEFALSNGNKNLAPVIKKIEATVKTIKTKVDTLILCGGTATVTAAIMLGLSNYDPNKVEGFELKKDELEKLIETLFKSNLEQIKNLLTTDKARADVITAGVVIIYELLKMFSPNKTIVSTYGPRHGFAMEKLRIKAPCKITYQLKTKVGA